MCVSCVSLSSQEANTKKNLPRGCPKCCFEAPKHSPLGITQSWFSEAPKATPLGIRAGSSGVFPTIPQATIWEPQKGEGALWVFQRLSKGNRNRLAFWGSQRFSFRFPRGRRFGNPISCPLRKPRGLPWDAQRQPFKGFPEGFGFPAACPLGTPRDRAAGLGSLKTASLYTERTALRAKL
jgi:hypothetical protein